VDGAARVRPPWHFELSSASRLLTDQLGTLDLRGFGADDLPLAIGAAGALLQYVRETQKTALPHITQLAVEERGDALQLDAATRRNLEIDASLSGQDSATLFTLLDSTTTAMGSRQLRRWLNRPLTNQQELRRRYQALALLVDARRFEEYQTMSIPTGTSVPGAELVLRVPALAPDAQTILGELLPLYVRNAIYRALVETVAGEQSARRTAMKNATDNAGEILNTLRRTYNRARQAQITQEIAEIVGGAAALE